MAFNLGVNVVEVDGRAAPTIVAAPVSIAGFLVRAQRGIPNLPVPIRGFVDFVNNFGSYATDSSGNPLYGAFAIRGFFDNGGADAYVVRIVGNGSRAASVVLNDRASVAAATLRVAAGLRGREDPGEWGNALTVTVADHPRGDSRIAAQIVGSQSEPFALADGQTLQVSVNGNSTPITITFNASDFPNISAVTAAAIATIINRQITDSRASVKASVTLDRQLVLSSTIPGASSQLAVAGGAAAALGFTGATASSDGTLAAGTTTIAVQSTGGFLPGSAVRLETQAIITATSALTLPIADGAAIQVTPNSGTPVIVAFTGETTAAQVIAAINRQARGFTAMLTSGNRLVLVSSVYGLGSSLAIAAPPTPATNATGALGLTGVTPVASTRIYGELTQVSDAQKLVRLATGLPAGGLNANLARIQSVEFDLIVNRNGVEVERFESLCLQNTLNYYAPTIVNDANSGSRYIVITPQANAAGAGQNVPAIGNFALGATSTTSGRNGDPPLDAQFIGDPATRTGLFAFDSVNIQLLACPETTSTGLVSAALSYCENRGDVMFVGTVPQNHDLSGIKSYAAPFRGRKIYGALYAPWIQIVNPLDSTGNNPRLWIPPVGHVLGMYARIAEARGVWKAPAGDEARLFNAIGVSFDMNDPDHTDLVKNGGVNGIRAIPGSGVIVDASRTLSTDTRWLFVNVRRLFNYVKASLRDGLRWVAQEPHSEELRRAVKFNVVTPFLLGLWQQGAFGTDPPNQVFTVKCDAENNPQPEVNLGNFKLEVFFYPVKPAETIVIIVGQQESGAKATEGSLT